MDIRPSALAKLLLPKLPSLSKTVALHTLGLSPTSKVWDLRTELTVSIMRSFMDGPPQTLSHTQKLSMRDPGVKGGMWVSRVKFGVDDGAVDGVRDVVLRSVREMCTPEQEGESWEPRMEPLEAEWTGYRGGVRPDEPEPSIADSAKYDNLMKEVSSDIVILYFHGGAHFLCDPASHRGLVARLCQKTGGRALSVRYRLSPQNPFPAALMDALFAYLALIHPPPGSPHAPIPASHIVFAGDSAGGQVCFSLLQLLLQIQRSPDSKSIDFHGKQVEIPLPAGVACNSPWLDITRCMPSIHGNAKYDYLPLPPADDSTAQPPRCAIWPASPPRADIFCTGAMLTHPLVSPLAADDWTHSPPVFIVCGEEQLSDEASIVARRMSTQGVRIVWEQYEAQPHVFCMVLDGTAVSKMSYESWAGWIRAFVESPGKVEEGGMGTYVTAKKLGRRAAAVGGEGEVAGWSAEEVRRRIGEAQRRRVEGFDKSLLAAPVEVVAQSRL